jgi:hypothetical protein
MFPTASVLTNQKTSSPAPKDLVLPAIAYPPSEVATNEKAASPDMPPYVLLHIEAALTETTKGKNNKTKIAMPKKNNFPRNVVTK